MCVGGQYPYEIPVNVRFQGGWAPPEFLWKMLTFPFLGGGTSGSPNPCSANTVMALYQEILLETKKYPDNITAIFSISDIKTRCLPVTFSNRGLMASSCTLSSGERYHNLSDN